MGNAVRHRKPLATLVGIAPDSCVRAVSPPSRSRLQTMVGGFGDHVDIEIDVELENEPPPANDVERAWDVVQAQWRDTEPVSEPRLVTPPPRASAAITLPSESEVQPSARSERIKDIGIVLIASTLMLSVIALMAALL